jgi:diguanylate cyclase (GGDEF)-like protein
MQLRHLANRNAAATSPNPAPTAASAPDATIDRSGPDPYVILPSIGEVIYEWDLISDRLVWTPNLAEVLGPVAAADLSTGRAYSERLSPESSTSRYDAIAKSDARDAGDGAPYQAIYALVAPRETGVNEAIWVEDAGRWFSDGGDRPARAHGALRVITERHEKERALALNSEFDALTGVLNRAQLAERTTRYLQLAERNRKPFAVLLVALENLFALNRTYGYDAGDQIIAGLARRLRGNVRVNDLVARHAGNKFGILLEDCDAEQTKAAAARLIATVVATPFDTSTGPVPASIRIGAVVAPREGRSAHVLFQRAEEALDVARQSTDARFVAYTASLARDDARLRALRIADSIVSALNEQRVELAFQPIVHATTGACSSFEALLRVRLADGTLVAPGELLPVAEKAGLVRLLDRRVTELAIARLVEDRTLRLSVNASLATVLDPEWPERITRALAEAPGVAERLTLEITETTIIEDIDSTRHVVDLCKRLGVKVAMDDFGSGHTSFRNLRELAFDLVKIDGVFVRNVTHSEDDRFFVKTLIDLAHHLNLKIVAEWVEDAETAALLRDWGVDYFQGSLFGSAEAAPSEKLLAAAG